MGAKSGPAVLRCVTCGELKPAGRFEPGRRKCLACQADRGRTPPPAAAVWARARDRALRGLAAEHVDLYRQALARRLAAVPAAVPRPRARRRAAGQALSDLAKQYPERYRELYERELKAAWAEPLPRRRGRPPGAPDRLSLAAASWGMTWRRDGSPSSRRGGQTAGARRRAELEAVRERAAELFAQEYSPSQVARQVGVARQTAVSWHARWRTGGRAALRSRDPSRRPAISDRQLPAIEQALLQGAEAHGFDGDVWTTARVAVVIQRLTGVQLGRQAVQRLLRERLGWRFQPATPDATGVTAAVHPRPSPASATDALAAVAAAALADLEDPPTGRPGPARSTRPASPTQRRDAIARAWQDEPGIADTALAERTRAHYAAIYRRFLTWLADELGRPPTRQDLSGDVLARWIAQRASVGGHSGGGLSSASLRLECSALRHLARHAGHPELAARLHASQQQAPPPQTIAPAQYERLLLAPDLTTAVGVRDRAILRLLGDVGLRPSEVRALTVKDIIWSADGHVPVQLKVAWGQGRVVPLTPQATAALGGWLLHHPDWQPDAMGRELPAEAPVFVALGPPKTAGRAITEAGLLRQVLRYGQQAGIPAPLRYPYVLRHYWASQQVARGITPAQLQARGGWRDRRSAQAYFQRPLAAAALAAALDLDRETPPAR